VPGVLGWISCASPWMPMRMTATWAGTPPGSRHRSRTSHVSRQAKGCLTSAAVRAVTTELVQRLGATAVAAVDPSEQFVAAARERHPGVDVYVAGAEQLPFADGEFDAALAQLVVHFMDDPARGLAEMARVTREDGVVAACVWDHAGGHTDP
jgi:SAM-dependent methyltransferase